MTGAPWRIAIVGAGPAGLYATHEVLRQSAAATVDLIDRLPTLGGLARSGVAPDHHARRDVIGWYERLALASGRFRFCGNLEVGRDVSPSELADLYDAVIYSHGCPVDRRLGIPGEHLAGSHSAADLVGWYNGHPDFSHLDLDLSCERAVVIGNGNVALDVARVLLTSTDLLQTTDIADHALDALADSNVREVVIVGRRDVEHCAFTTPELVGLAEYDFDITVENANFPEISHTPASIDDFASQLKCQLLKSYTARKSLGRRRMVLRFLTSPVAIVGTDRVTAVQLVGNRLQAVDGRVVAEPSRAVEELCTGLVIRSVGFCGIPLTGLPFDEARGIVPNEAGRVLSSPESTTADSAYVAGWIKRGPSGVIGSNKLCARETVATMFADLESRQFRRQRPGLTLDAVESQRGGHLVDYTGWKRIDRFELRSAAGSPRPRVKVTDWDSLLGIGLSRAATRARE
jgi:ferredoxin/flavodoxin---NADP+ reductase